MDNKITVKRGVWIWQIGFLAISDKVSLTYNCSEEFDCVGENARYMKGI